VLLRPLRKVDHAAVANEEASQTAFGVRPYLTAAASGLLKIEAMFDRAKQARKHKGPHVLYHYTTWEAAESIIASQKFRATAHNCTNDPGELTSADATILEAFRAAHARATGMTARLIRLFLESYEHSRISSSRRCYLICFSQTRDDPHQWSEYGGRGTGVCLGLRLFEIPSPKVPELASQFMPVQYLESDWRSKFDEWLDAFVEVFSMGADTEHNWRLALDSLTVTTTAWALTAKLPKWEPEQEVRMILLVREGAEVQPSEEIRSDGTVKRYLTVPVTSLRKMPVVEIIVGPNCDPATGRERAIRMLQAAGYHDAASKVRNSSCSLTRDLIDSGPATVRAISMSAISSDSPGADRPRLTPLSPERMVASNR
jgi:hypothetical protein